MKRIGAVFKRIPRWGRAIVVAYCVADFGAAVSAIAASVQVAQAEMAAFRQAEAVSTPKVIIVR